MSFAIYDEKPWLARYPEQQQHQLTPAYDNLLEAFRARLNDAPDSTIIQYFDGCITHRELDLASNALANALILGGFQPGDRLGLLTQNDPAFVIGLLAAWKAGGIVIAINPMNKERELAYILNDSGAKALLCLDELYSGSVQPALATENSQVLICITYSALDYQSLNDKRILDADSRVAVPAGVLSLSQIVQNSMYQGDAALPDLQIGSDDTALLAYTSGTTGQPKGAMITHGNMVFNAYVFKDWAGLTREDVNLCIAPLFHITGLIAHVATSLLVGCRLVLNHRFHPEVALDIIRRERPTFTIGAITAFISQLNTGKVQKGDFNSFRSIYSGGAPVSAAVTEQFQAITGHYLHNAYGMTETTSATLLVPQGSTAPVDVESGALSIGVPVFNTMIRILKEDGTAAKPGEVGELAVSGPQVMKGYWNQPESTASAMKDGFLLSGDVGFMDENGWVFLVDRKKDMINAGGYKVWPREVEDVMYGHPAVREVAIVGIADDYRGETVKAFVSLKEGMSATTDELIAYGKANMSSYKYPRVIEFMKELPKTNTGKILRRSLR
ncbi:AMP-binding protein [Alcaligenaceae bacterium]|nr:AMP-binding protein [Alcaligenaceae bacterium]